jgi:hypothetical protein
VVVVFAMFVQVTPAFVEYSHLVTEPVFPANVKFPEFVPLQTVVPPETVPPQMEDLP